MGRSVSAFLVLCATAAVGLSAQTFATLHTFGGIDGVSPWAALVQGTDGNLYGTTFSGGSGGGTVFRITPDGALTTLYNLCTQQYCADGNSPEGALQAWSGDFYGTANMGGLYNGGTVFRMSADGTFTTLYAFSPEFVMDGVNPAAGITQATNGDLYGTTSRDGAITVNEPYGGGTIFRIAAGVLTTIYSFCPEGACTTGQFPVAALAQANKGDLFGTTQQGGPTGHGSIFKITPDGALATVYTFVAKVGARMVTHQRRN